MAEDIIKPSEIGTVINTSESKTELPYDLSAHTLRSHQTKEYTVRYQDGTENTIQSKAFVKEINELPYYLDPNTPPAAHYMKMWHLANEAGLPVAPTIQINDNELSIIDISENGVFFDKAMAWKIDPDSGSQNKLDPSILNNPSVIKFLEIPLEDIEDEAKKIIDIANKNDLWLPVDDPMNLLVLPDGRWRIVVLDPMMLRQYDQKKKEYKTTKDLPFPDWNSEYTPKELNERGLETFINYIKTIKENMLPLNKQII